MNVCGAFDTSPRRTCHNGVARGRVVGHQVAARIATKQQSAGRRQVVMADVGATPRARRPGSAASSAACRSCSRSPAGRCRRTRRSALPCRRAPWRRAGRSRSGSTSRSSRSSRRRTGRSAGLKAGGAQLIAPAFCGDTSAPPMWKSLAGSRSGLAACSSSPSPSCCLRELAWSEVLAGDAVEDEEVAVARRLQHQLARAAVERRVHEHRRLRRVPVVRVVRRRLRSARPACRCRR